MQDVKLAARFTQHAMERFAERFPEHDAVESWKRAKLQNYDSIRTQYYFLDEYTGARWLVGHDKADKNKMVILTVLRD